jgi:hypothetical protein
MSKFIREAFCREIMKMQAVQQHTMIAVRWPQVEEQRCDCEDGAIAQAVASDVTKAPTCRCEYSKHDRVAKLGTH